jgi:hypothetical protein
MNCVPTTNKYQFRCSTKEAHTIKTLFDFLYYSFRENVTMEITKEGLKMCESDQKRTTISYDLNKNNFSSYICRQPRTIKINVQEPFISSLRRSIKKQDSLDIYILKDNTDQIMFLVKNKDSLNQRTCLQTSIVDTRKSICQIPTDYHHPINLTDKEFKGLCKGMEKVNDTMVISCQRPRTIQMRCDCLGIMGRNGSFGDEEDEYDEEEFKNWKPYEQKFPTMYITKLIKLVSMSGGCRIYISHENPICFEMNVGRLGVLSTYIYSKQQIENIEQEEEEGDDVVEEPSDSEEESDSEIVIIKPKNKD